MASALTPEMVAALLAGPAGPPPPGVTPQLEGAPNIQIVGRAWDTVGLVLMILAFTMRLYAQLFMSKQYLIEDFLVALSFAIFVALFGVLYVVQTSGYSSGYHMWDVTLGTFIKTQKLVVVSEILYVPAFALVKVGILLQLLRTFSPTPQANPWMRRGCLIWMVVIPVFYTIVLFLDIFDCSPREKSWNPFVPGQCVISDKTVFLFTAFFNMFSDILILVLPLPAIYALHMKLEKKLLVGGLFATGGLACVVSIIRLYYSFVIVKGTDISWNYVALGITAFFEGAIAVVVFSLPVAPKFMQTVPSRVWYALTGRSTSQGSEPDRSGGFEPMNNNAAGRNTFGTPRRRQQDSDLGVSSISKYLGPEPRESGNPAIIGKGATSRLESLESKESLHMAEIYRGGSGASHSELV